MKEVLRDEKVENHHSVFWSSGPLCCCFPSRLVFFLSSQDFVNAVTSALNALPAVSPYLNPLHSLGALSDGCHVCPPTSAGPPK